MSAKKNGAQSGGGDTAPESLPAHAAQPRANRRRLKRRATDPLPPADVPPNPAVARDTPKAKAKLTDARRGYDPYDSGELIKPRNPGVPRDLRSLGSRLKSNAKKKG